MYFYKYNSHVKFSDEKLSNIIGYVSDSKQILPEIKYDNKNILGLNYIQPFLYLYKTIDLSKNLDEDENVNCIAYTITDKYNLGFKVKNNNIINIQLNSKDISIDKYLEIFNKNITLIEFNQHLIYWNIKLNTDNFIFVNLYSNEIFYSWIKHKNTNLPFLISKKQSETIFTCVKPIGTLTEHDYECIKIKINKYTEYPKIKIENKDSLHVIEKYLPKPKSEIKTGYCGTLSNLTTKGGCLYLWGDEKEIAKNSIELIVKICDKYNCDYIELTDASMVTPKGIPLRILNSFKQGIPWYTRFGFIPDKGLYQYQLYKKIGDLKCSDFFTNLKWEDYKYDKDGDDEDADDSEEDKAIIKKVYIDSLETCKLIWILNKNIKTISEIIFNLSSKGEEIDKAYNLIDDFVIYCIKTYMNKYYKLDFYPGGYNNLILYRNYLKISDLIE